MNRLIFNKFFVAAIITIAVIFSSCQKEYFYDTGISKAEYDGNALQYLQSNNIMFDTLVSVIKLANMESYFTDSSLTFFAPADYSINRTYKYINDRLRNGGQDTLTSLSSLKPEFWRQMLMMYMFKGKRGLESFPQYDRLNTHSFRGEFLYNWQGTVMNIGVIYNDAKGLKYMGYRQLCLNYIRSEANPFEGVITANVATSNVKPKNGYVHVLAYGAHDFGFDMFQAWMTAKFIGFN